MIIIFGLAYVYHFSGQVQKGRIPYICDSCWKVPEQINTCFVEPLFSFLENAFCFVFFIFLLESMKFPNSKYMKIVRVSAKLTRWRGDVTLPKQKWKIIWCLEVIKLLKICLEKLLYLFPNLEVIKLLKICLEKLLSLFPKRVNIACVDNISKQFSDTKILHQEVGPWRESRNKIVCLFHIRVILIGILGRWYEDL